LGKRRTQDLAIPLVDTEPFHWDGELSNVGAVMDEVFVERMGGVFQSESRIEALSRWLVEAPKPVRSVLDKELSASAVRGQELFESKTVGCASCHSGRAFTDNRNYFVGTSADKIALQVPSLVGIAARPPYMHDGCAKTLLERFDPKCGGGDRHGNTSHLSGAELDDLVAYLRTL
jgi:mono/diheme cytochrome c family protein